MHTIDDRLHAQAAQQLGLLTRKDVFRVGGNDNYICSRLKKRYWQELHPGVYLTGSAKPTWLQRSLGACFACGPNTVLSHRAAAAVHWLDGSNEGVIEVTSAQTKCPRPRGVVLHRTRRWEPVDRTVKRGVPVTAVNRTLIDYGAVVPPILVERAVEDAFRRGRTSEGALRRRLAQIGGRGCRGSGVLHRVLDLRPAGRPARSGFEVMLLDVIREFGLPMPVRNYPVKVEGVVVAEIDLAYVGLLGALEANGARWHSTRRAHLRDEERKALLRSLGWRIADFEWDEVVHRPEVAAARIQEFFARLHCRQQ